jgi:hypothetical protein
MPDIKNTGSEMSKVRTTGVSEVKINLPVKIFVYFYLSADAERSPPGDRIVCWLIKRKDLRGGGYSLQGHG